MPPTMTSSAPDEAKRKALRRYEILRTNPDARLIERAKCALDPEYFIFNDQRYVKTKDEHDEINPIKAFPDKEVYRHIIRRIHEEQTIFLPKSRQIMMSWLICAYILWDANFKPYRLNLIQSKREDDAASLTYDGKSIDTSRIALMLDRMPDWLVTPYELTHCVIQFTDTGSKIWGIPQGADIVRSNTASILFSDEAAFQPEFESSYIAAQPAVRGGGKYIVASSANPGYFESLLDLDVQGIRASA